SCTATKIGLFDHLVGASEQRGWHREAEGFGGCQVNDHREFGRLQDRQVGGLGALEDLTGVNAYIASARSRTRVAYLATRSSRAGACNLRRPDDTCPHDRWRSPSGRRLRQLGERDRSREPDRPPRASRLSQSRSWCWL